MEGPVKLSLPPDAKVYNFLYHTTDTEYLVQDILVLELPSGLFIDVGWFPEHDPSGSYVIRYYRNEEERECAEEVFEKTVDGVVVIVERLAREA